MNPFRVIVTQFKNGARIEPHFEFRDALQLVTGILFDRLILLSNALFCQSELPLRPEFVPFHLSQIRPYFERRVACNLRLKVEHQGRLGYSGIDEGDTPHLDSRNLNHNSAEHFDESLLLLLSSFAVCTNVARDRTL